MTAGVMGTVYRCPNCGSEVTVISSSTCGDFSPRCCNRPMQPREGRVLFYRCPRCGSEIAVIGRAPEDFTPVCCNVPMAHKAA